MTGVTKDQGINQDTLRQIIIKTQQPKNLRDQTKSRSKWELLSNTGPHQETRKN